ncbi:AAA family ATPase [Pedobacter sp. D749]|uniref:AAA family ATPase n=1 Tax=Pedobacter sp. D749 TaxID=2856523 RepID=UPI001C57F517|nr:AAA family ATPase [Pedobacter sp. D749]QXU43582.1 ATP-binding protein [Pedobacter sp. D749]
MRIKNIQLKEFKRFDNLTIDLGESPKKIIALVGPNGCGKSSVFDAFEEKLKDFRYRDHEGASFFSKSLFYSEEGTISQPYDKNRSILIQTASGVELQRKSFYIRTAYRFTAKLNVTKIEKISEIQDGQDDPTSSIALDGRLVNNYKRLIEIAYSEFDASGNKTGDQIKQELIGKVNDILSKVIDAKISNLGNVLSGKGQLYFEKGNAKNFPYANLSAGEKEVVDIVLDLVVKVPFFNETVYCIDEPELHLNTAVQRKLLVEIEKLIPDNCQLWVATHSIGFLRALQDELKEKSQILDFSEDDYFNGIKTIKPMKPSRKNWQRIFQTALEDLTGLLAPKKIIYCEGKVSEPRANVEDGMDAKVLNNIFEEDYQEALFISSGGNTELDQRSNIAIAILGKVFSDVEILVLKDRDMNSGKPIDEGGRQLYLKNNKENHRVLKRFEIENYLFDKEVLKKYCVANGLTFNEQKYDTCFPDIINNQVKDQFNIVKSCCNIPGSIAAEKFKINLSDYITSDMIIYKELENEIFNRK